MAETQGNKNNAGQQAENKSFSQAEVDAIVGERLARERAKYPDYDDLKSKAAEYDKLQEASKSELQKAQEKSAKLQAQIDTMKKASQVRDIRDKVSHDTGVPVELLSGEDEDSCKKQAESILKFAKGSKYPGIREERHESGRKTTQSSDNATDEDYRELAGQIFGRKE